MRPLRASCSVSLLEGHRTAATSLKSRVKRAHRAVSGTRCQESCLFLVAKENSMFWKSRRRTRRPVSSCRHHARPALESLEGRDLLSVSVMELTDARGAVTGLSVVANGANDMVTISDNSATGHTTVVADGRTMDFAQQFPLVDLELMGSRDFANFNIVGDYNQRHADLFVDLGTGENHFTFNPGL